MLDKQNVSIQFAEGLDTKSDKKLVLPGKLLTLENAVFEKTGSLIKTPGFVALGQSIIGGSSITSGDALNVFGDELLEFNKESVYSYSLASDAWINKGGVVPVVTSVENVIRNSYEQTQSDSDVVSNGSGGVVVYAWKDSSGGIRASVTDEDSGSLFQSNVLISATGQYPKVLKIAGNLFVVYVEGTSYKQRQLSPTSPTAFLAAVTIATDVHASTKFHDITKFNEQSAIFTYRNSSGNIKVAYLDLNGTEGTTLKGFPNAVAVAEVPENCITIVVNPITFDIQVAYHNTSDGVRVVGFLPSLIQSFAPITIDTTVMANIVNITGIFKDNTCTYFYEISTVNPWYHHVATNTVTSVGVAGTVGVFLASVGLASKAFSVSDIIYVGLVHQSTTQTTYFIARGDGSIVARVLYGLAGGLTDGPTLPSPRVLSNGTVYFSGGVKGRLVSQSGTLYSLRGVSRVIMDFNPSSTSIYQSAQLGENLHIVGGFLSNYDGLSITEHGFHLYPEELTLSQSASGGSMSNGTYQYCAVWEWVDNKGQIHRSAPSIPKSITLTGGGSSQKVTLTIPTLQMTSKTASRGRSEVVCAVYRTEGVIPGQIFYRVSSVSSPTYNNISVESISFVDTVSDADLIKNELLYTTGGVLSNDPPPACSKIAASKSRVFVVDDNDSNSIAYSQTFSQGYGVAFSDYLRKRIDPRGGKITALAVMDEKIIVFKKDYIFYFSGSGPNNTGSLDDFSEPELVSSDVGCVDPRSIVLYPDGLLFKSSKGIYVLHRYLQVEYIGAPVEDFNELSLVSSDLLASKNQVRFVHSNGVCLIYDYYRKQWGTRTNMEGKDSVIWRDAFCYVRTSGGTVYKETPGIYTDNNVDVTMKIATAWIKMAGLQGYQRVYRAVVLGDYKSDHVMRVSVGYDYADDYSDTYLFVAGDVLTSTTFGDDSTYGQDNVIYGAESDGLYQFSIKLGRQKCQAIRFMFEDIIRNTSGPSFTLADLTLEVGLKRGTNKVGAIKRI